MKNEHKMLIKYACILHTYCMEQKDCHSCIFEEDNDCLLTELKPIKIEETYNDEEKNLVRFATLFNRYCESKDGNEPCLFAGGRTCYDVNCPICEKPKTWDMNKIRALLREDRQDD